MVGTNELDWLTGFVEVDGHGQLQGVECSEVFRQTDSTNQPFGQLEVSGGQPDDSQSSGRHIAAKPARQLLKIRLVEFSDSDLLSKKWTGILSLIPFGGEVGRHVSRNARQAGANVGQRHFGRSVGLAIGMVVGVEQPVDCRFPGFGNADFDRLADQGPEFRQNERVGF
jgi:hypothetical protein